MTQPSMSCEHTQPEMLHESAEVEMPRRRLTHRKLGCFYLNDDLRISVVILVWPLHRCVLRFRPGAG